MFGLINPPSGQGCSLVSFGRIDRHDRRNRGAVLVYACIAMAAFTAVASLVIDVAHARLVKTQLQCAADAAARNAASGLLTDLSTAKSNAVFAAQANTAD